MGQLPGPENRIRAHGFDVRDRQTVRSCLSPVVTIFLNLAATRRSNVFRIKICGVTRADDARAVAQAGGDAIGLNFFRESPRFVQQETAVEIAAAIDEIASIVGVFVNHTAEQIRAAAEAVPLDYVQLHGDEPAEILRELGELNVIRAFRCGPSGLAPVVEFADRAANLGFELSGVLIDSHQPGLYGGTGKTADWRAVCALGDQLDSVPIVLAGGLRPDNVADAISAARPAAVDTASGVESSPGVKSSQLVAEFVSAAQHAFHDVSPRHSP